MSVCVSVCVCVRVCVHARKRIVLVGQMSACQSQRAYYLLSHSLSLSLLDEGRM